MNCTRITAEWPNHQSESIPIISFIYFIHRLRTNTLKTTIPNEIRFNILDAAMTACVYWNDLNRQSDMHNVGAGAWMVFEVWHVFTNILLFVLLDRPRFHVQGWGLFINLGFGIVDCKRQWRRQRRTTWLLYVNRTACIGLSWRMHRSVGRMFFSFMLKTILNCVVHARAMRTHVDCELELNHLDTVSVCPTNKQIEMIVHSEDGINVEKYTGQHPSIIAVE